MSEEKVPIPNRVKNVAVGGHVCGAEDIIDDDLNKLQSVINSEAIFGTDSSDEAFINRITANKSSINKVDIGAAIINRIKGNTLKFQSIISGLGKFSSSSIASCDITNNSDGSKTVTKIGTGTFAARFTPYSTSNIAATHRYYIRVVVKLNAPGTVTIGEMNGTGTSHNQASKAVTINDTDYNIISYKTATNLDHHTYGTLGIKVTSSSATTMTIHSVLFLSLTNLFGFGNEPTAANFEKLVNANIGFYDGFYDAQSLSLINVNSFSLKTIGFNLCENNTAELISGEKYQVTGAYTSLSIYDSTIIPDENNMFTSPFTGTLLITGGDNSTCVHLVNKDDRNNIYEDNWSIIKNIPINTLVGKLNGEGSDVIIFSDGLKKVGTTFDELIKYGNTVKAIKRIDSRAYESGDENDSTVVTNKTITYFCLSTPLEYIVSNFGMPIQYKVDNYGLEKVILNNTGTTNSVSPIMEINYNLKSNKIIKDIPYEYVSKREQTFSEQEKKQILTNIGISNSVTAEADATDLSTAIALVNQIKSILVNSNIMV